MPLINTSVPNLIQGVSQQPDTTRYAGQGEEQENALSSVVKGLVKRPPTQFLGELFSDSVASSDGDILPTAFIDFIERSDDERYVLIIDNDKLRIFRIETDTQTGIEECSIDVNGVTKTSGVDIGTNDYLYSTTGSQNIKTLTIGDTTLITNTAKAVQQGTTTTPSIPDEAVVFIKQADYEKEYKIIVGNQTATCKTGTSLKSGNDSSSNDTGTGSDATRTGLIIDHLVSDVSQFTNINALKIDDAHMLITSTVSGGLDGIKVSDDMSGTGIGIAYKESNSISDLPLVCSDGLVVKVVGDVELDQDDYYVKFNTTDHVASGRGSWEETVGPNILDRIGSDCPVQLVNTASNQFELMGMPLNKRNAGDDQSNPFPSFVGASISNLFLFKSRLGVLSRDTVTLSESSLGVNVNATKYSVQTAGGGNQSAGHYYPLYLDPSVIYGAYETLTFSEFDGVTFYLPEDGVKGGSSVAMQGVTPFNNAQSYTVNTERQGFNFFRTSVTTLLDDNPIDVSASASTSSVTNLRSAKEFQENLILFSDDAQFVLKGGDILTPKTVTISQATTFDYNKAVEPLNLGAFMYFPFNRGNFSGFREYSVNTNTDVYDSAEITEHVPSYIPKDIVKMTGTNAENIIAVVAGDASSTEQNTIDLSNTVESFDNTSHSFLSNDLIFHATAFNLGSSMGVGVDTSWTDFEGTSKNQTNVYRFTNTVQGRLDIRPYQGNISAAIDESAFATTPSQLTQSVSDEAGWSNRPYAINYGMCFADLSMSPDNGLSQLKTACSNDYTIETIHTWASYYNRPLIYAERNGGSESLDVRTLSNGKVRITVDGTVHESTLPLSAYGARYNYYEKMHFVLTGNSTTCSLYFNGNLVLTAYEIVGNIVRSPTFPSWRAIAIGGHATHSVRIYNKRLTSSQINTNFQGSNF